MNHWSTPLNRPSERGYWQKIQLVLLLMSVSSDCLHVCEQSLFRFNVSVSLKSAPMEGRRQTLTVVARDLLMSYMVSEPESSAE